MSSINAPVLDESRLINVLSAERAGGKTIAFANGCFDLLHVGHIRYLQGASAIADILVVGINSDDSVRAIKGEGRPVVSEQERAEVIAAIRGVDYVTIFREPTAERILSIVRPNFHCKGTDYTPESVPEAKLVESFGGKVVIVGDPKDHSTTELLKQAGRKQS